MIEKAKFTKQLYHPRFWLLWLGAGFMRLTLFIPLKIQMKLGALIGQLAMRFAKSRVHTAKRNIELCFPELTESEQHELLKCNFQETGKAIFDTVNAWWWSDEKVQRHSQIKGKEHVERTLSAGQGVILFAVHCLPLEMGARIFGQFNPGVGIYRPHKNPVMEYLQVKGRLRSNKAMVPKRDLRQMVRSLRNPDVIWYTADQDFGRSSAIFIPFFAVPDAATITGCSTLAKLGKAKVLPFFVERGDDDNSYNIEIMPPLDNFPNEDEQEDTIRGNRIIETLIQRNTAQYMWLHRRFKTRPNNTDKSLYE